MARLGNRLVHLVSRQLSALAGFCALRHLDLKFIGVDQVVSRDTETSAGNLLHSAAAQIAIWIAREAVFVFAALTGVRHATDTIHGNGQRLVCFLADRPVAHGAGRESLHDLLRRFNLFDGNGMVGVSELEQSA